MKIENRKSKVITTSLLWVALAALFCLPYLTGCDTLRFAPSESQKQIAFDTAQVAQAVNASGAAAATPATQKLVSGTAAALAYTGLPANPTIADYDATLQAANTDAAKRPTVDDVASSFDGWLSLGIGIAGLLGGGAGLKIASALKTVQTKAAALKEVVQGNETFKNYLELSGNTAALKAFSTAQTQVQTTATEQAVYAVRSELPQTVAVTATTAVNQS
jgi:hypothetical protein